MRNYIPALAVALTLVLAGTAQAAGKQTWASQRTNQIATDISGVPLEVIGEDDWNEWAYFLSFFSNAPSDPRTVLGFVAITAPPGTAFYHRVFISPDYWPTLLQAALYGTQTTGDTYRTAVAIMDIAHEAFHYKLMSSDESRVNACALQAFPTVLTQEFGLAATVSVTSTVSHRVRVKYRVRIHHHWVTRYRWKTVYQQVTTETPNQLFTDLVNDAKDFYSRQPAPYNSGTCT